ncbi:MAG: hypothetical protein GF364_06345 [Candidatus Lokiarchaeota archaeon]|nr:hypothetical protein [Candidatus Lokiarchaeota archaeon]
MIKSFLRKITLGEFVLLVFILSPLHVFVLSVNAEDGTPIEPPTYTWRHETNEYPATQEEWDQCTALGMGAGCNAQLDWLSIKYPTQGIGVDFIYREGYGMEWGNPTGSYGYKQIDLAIYYVGEDQNYYCVNVRFDGPWVWNENGGDDGEGGSENDNMATAIWQISDVFFRDSGKKLCWNVSTTNVTWNDAVGSENFFNISVDYTFSIIAFDNTTLEFALDTNIDIIESDNLENVTFYFGYMYTLWDWNKMEKLDPIFDGNTAVYANNEYNVTSIVNADNYEVFYDNGTSEVKNTGDLWVEENTDEINGESFKYYTWGVLLDPEPLKSTDGNGNMTHIFYDPECTAFFAYREYLAVPIAIGSIIPAILIGIYFRNSKERKLEGGSENAEK